MRGELLAFLTTCALLLAMTAAADPNETARPATASDASPNNDPEELAETGPPEQAHPLSSGALCGRGNHDLEDGSRDALLRSRLLFEAAIKYYPEAACGHVGLARALTSILGRGIEGNDDLAAAAIASARRAVAIDPRSATARAALAGALLAGLEVDAAAAEATAALALDPASLSALQTQAVVMTATGRHRRGLELIEKALDLGPGLVVSHHIKGNLLLLAGEEHLAIVSYGNALALCPDHMPSTLALATAYEQTGDFRSSARIFERVLADHPEESSRCHLYMGYSLMKRYSWNAALGALEKVSFTTHRGLSNGTAVYFRALCYEKLGRSEEAFAAFREVIDKWPDATIGFARPERLVSSAYEGLGRLQLASHETGKAVSILEEGAGRPDAEPDLLVRLATLYRDYHMPAESARLLERAASASLGPRSADRIMTAYILWSRLVREMADQAMLDRLTHSLQSRTPALADLDEFVYQLDAMRAFSIAGRGEEALASLRRATDAGYRQIEWIQNDPEMAALRGAPGFADLARQFAPIPAPTN